MKNYTYKFIKIYNHKIEFNIKIWCVWVSQFFCLCYWGLYFGLITLKIKCIIKFILKEVFDIKIQQKILETKMYQYVILTIRYKVAIEFKIH